MDPIRFVSLIAGLILVVSSFFWTAQVMMVRGAEPPYLARLVLRGARNFLHLASSFRPSPVRSQNLWALYVPFSLILIVVLSLSLACIGFALFLYGITENTARVALENSISAMSVLGFAGLPPTLRETIVAGFEAFTGPIFVALLIGYIVNIYAAYSQQHARVTDMDAKLGDISNGLGLIEAAARGPGLDSLSQIWQDWTEELADIQQTYRTVDGYLLIFAPAMTKHWSTDAAMVFDAANARNSLVALPPDPDAAQCLDIGTVAIGLIASHYGHRTLTFHRPPPPAPVTRAQFEDCATELRSAGIPVVEDLSAAWDSFEHVRQSYAQATLKLQRMQTSPTER